ncbi:hypothetical protein IGJ02_002625 [Enterococcus sp. DIV0724b]|uniref:winged helix-turn-helix domain-containing protein n=1 Tax=Enterococcus sp. DIV0724b TaxID=2774694 RepID=UPI003D2FFE84
MHKISLVSSSITMKKSIEEAFTRENSMIQIFPKEIDLNQLKESEIIILEENSPEDISYLCSIIFSIKEQASSFIWILSNQRCYINDQVYLQIGVDAILDGKWFPEEVALTVRNTFSRFKEGKSKKIILSHKRNKDRSYLEMRMGSQSVLVKSIGKEKEIELTKKEYKLLALLISDPTRAFSYQEIHKQVWNQLNSSNNYRIANLVLHLRNKLDENEKDSYIKTVRSIGYRLVDLEIRN